MPTKYFYLISPLAAGGSSRTVFTYHAERILETGSIVQAELNKRQSFGVVLEKVSEPNFPTKPATPLPLMPLPQHLVRLARWISRYYATPLAKVWQSALPAKPYVEIKREIAKPPSAPRQKSPKITLSSEQKKAVEQIVSSPSRNFLLHGVTGSGKTQVYIELAKNALAEGKSAIILVPEISLTPQITSQLATSFASSVVLTHSGMTPAQRRLAWQSVLTAEGPLVIVGPRSAVFMPAKNLGFIIIDESHDSSYKQDQSPRYHTHAVAAELANLAGAKLVLGTATPLVTNRYLAERGRIEYLELRTPIFKAKRQPPTIVDLKDKAQLKKSRVISTPLLAALTTTLENGRQSILFLNRRGSARLAVCSSCGWSADCPNCKIPLTWHGDEGELRCHWCGHHQAPPASCTKCGNLQIKFVGSGTKRLEDELRRLLPEARLARLDRDSFDPRTVGQLYGKLQKNEIDILIGTQMITKGLDLPGVETVGVVLADSMLYLPDFSAAERAFQLLYQVSGRAGRRDNTLANVVIQTYSPKHPAIMAATDRNYDKFYKNELKERRLSKYPPFTYLLKLTVRKSSRPTAQKASQSLMAELSKKLGASVELIGPAPTWRETLGGNYEWQIIAKSKARSQLIDIAKDLPQGWVHDLDPADLL